MKKLNFIPDGIIFDVDGTIWDSTPVVTQAWNKALTDTGFGYVQVTADRLKGLFGLPMIEIMRDILPGVSDKELKRFEKVCNEYEEDYISRVSGHAYINIEETIKELSRICPVIIVSNCQSGYIEIMMKHLDLNDYVTDKILKRSVYVGDTIMDANACIEANEPFIFASYGFGHVDDYDFIIDEPKALLNLFK